MKKTKLILLGAGKIGDAILNLLSHTGDYELTVADRDPARMDYVKEANFPNVKCVQADLSDSSAVADLIANYTRDAVDVGLFRALRNAPFECETLWLIAARGDDRARGGENPGPRNDFLIHGLLQSHIGVTRAFGSQVADGGEAGH